MSVGKMRDQRGFTLVEMMVVVALISIIGLIAYKKFTGQMEKSKVETSATLALSWGKAMKEWKTQENSVDFTFLANDYANDDERKRAFGRYAFSLGDERNPWGRDTAGNYYTLVLTTSDGCNGILSDNTHTCANLQLATPNDAFAIQVAQKINERMGIIDPATGKGKTAAAQADVELTDPATNEIYYKGVFAVAAAGNNVVQIYAP